MIQITVKGMPDQIIQIPEQDLSGMQLEIIALKERLSKLESNLPSIPIPIPNSGRIPYPLTSVWYKKLAPNEPIHPKNTIYKTELTKYLWSTNAWVNGLGYGANNFGCPVYFVTSTDTKKSIIMTKDIDKPIALELKAGINLPANMVAADGTDGHCCIYNSSNDTEYNFWKLKKDTSGNWTCMNAGILHDVSKSDGTLKRLSYWNSARASHLPLGGGLITKSALEKGIIETALVFATPNSAKSFVYPAKSSDGWETIADAIPQGTRFRFPSDITIESTWTPLTKMLVIAVRDYGMILGDTTMGMATVLYCETPPGKTRILDPYMNGKHLWDIVGTKTSDGEFPWSKLIAIAN